MYKLEGTGWGHGAAAPSLENVLHFSYKVLMIWATVLGRRNSKMFRDKGIVNDLNQINVFTANKLFVGICIPISKLTHYANFSGKKVITAPKSKVPVCLCIYLLNNWSQNVFLPCTIFAE